MKKKKSIFEFTKAFLMDDDYRFMFLASRGFYKTMPDEKYLKRMYKASLGKELNLEHPVSFNEKLQWLKINNRRPEYTMMVDKYLVRDYVAKKIGKEYLIPLLGVWDSPDEIDFNKLPKQFVLKCNHNSGGGMCICRDKTKLNIEKVKKDLRAGLSNNYFYYGREWPYKNVQRKIICEKYMSDMGDQLSDYKIHCFDGIPKVVLVCRDRFKKTGLTEDFFSDQWEHLDVRRPEHPNSSQDIPCPKELAEILNLSKRLSEAIPFVRIDFYIINGKIYFGEITFYPASGFERFIPDNVDKLFGKWVTVPHYLS